MKLKVKILDISAEGVYVAIIHINDAIILNIKPEERIRISNGTKSIVAITNVTYSNKNIKQGEIGLFREFEEEGFKNNSHIFVKYENEPNSVLFIKEKLDGKRLNEEKINSIVKDVLSNSLTEVEASYFISACYVHGLDDDETAFLTKAIANNGEKLHFRKPPILDKHCLGGLAANRTTMIVIPIIAAAGFTIPKTSSRSISSPAGTADTMEVLAPVSFSAKEIKKLVDKTRACIVWGGAVNLASTDDKLIRLRHPLSLDPEGLLLASILAKKSAADSTHVLIDIPVGKETKVKNKGTAQRLGDRFVALGRKLGLKIKVVITNGEQPIGNGVGPALEARDVLLTLQNKGPRDLKTKALCMAGMMLDMVGVKNGYVWAKEILESGRAYRKMQEIIEAQGGNPKIQPENIKFGKHTYELKANRSGSVINLNNHAISHLAKLCGAPLDKGAGLYLHHKLREKVKKGDVLITFYSESRDMLDHVIKMIPEMNPVEIK